VRAVSFESSLRSRKTKRCGGEAHTEMTLATAAGTRRDAYKHLSEVIDRFRQGSSFRHRAGWENIMETAKSPVIEPGISRPLWLFLMLTFSMIGVVPFVRWMSFHPDPRIGVPGHTLLSLSLPIAPFVLWALFYLPFFVIRHFRPGNRRSDFRLGVVAAVVVVAFFLASYITIRVWQHAILEFTERQKPLVAAMHSYVADHGHPPESLAELVPKYLPSIPHSGWGTRPTIHLLEGEPEAHYGNEWVLQATPPQVPFQFDWILYLPRQNYPERGYGGGLSRQGDWGYVHE